MRKITFALGMLLLCSSQANADDRRTRSVTAFPDVFPAMKAQESPLDAPQRVVNDEKLKGKAMYATTVTDYEQPRFVKFYLENLTSFETVGYIKTSADDPDYFRRYGMVGGNLHDGKYLAQLVFNYDMGQVELYGFASVDLSTGKYEMLKEVRENTFYYMDAMTTDPVTNKMIGLSHYFDDYAPSGAVISHIGEVNPATGDYITRVALGEYYFCIGYDNDGQLWAARWEYDKSGSRTGSCLVTLDPEDRYKETSNVRLTMDGKQFMMYFNNSMNFDPTTDELWMLACEYIDGATSYSQYMVKVDPKTGVMTSYGKPSSYYNQISTGLYVPGFKGSVRGSAYCVSDLTSAFDENGRVTLSWTNPTLTWNKNELEGLEEVLVCRDALDNVVATLKENVTVGGEMTWTDTDAPQGLHTYYVVPCRVAGERGVPDSWNAFSGKDVPGIPENVSLTMEGSALKLAWEAPELGANDGWYDKATLAYNIKRYPDNKLVAENIKETTFTDDKLGEINEYYYDIEPVSADGKGTVATSGKMLAGSAYIPPYTTDMKTDAERRQWTSVDANGDGTKFEVSDWEPFMGMKISTSSYENNDYAISPAMSLKGGKTYKTTWTVYISDCAQPDWNPDNHNDFRFTAGRGTTAEAQTTEMLKKEYYQTSQYNTYNTFEAFFTPDEDGDYNFGFNVTTNGSQDQLCLTAFTVEEVFANDLAAESFAGTVNPSKGAASDYVVTVKNYGSKDVDGTYKVQIVRLDGDDKVVIGETEAKGKIASQATAEVTVSATPDVEGEFLMAASVVMNGDENTGNDVSAAKTVNAAPEGTVPFNLNVTGANSGVNSRMPLSFVKNNSHTQAIYNNSELAGVTKIHRLAFEYNANAESKTPVTDIEIDAALYLSLSDEASYDKDNSTWQPLSGQTKVYEGKMKFMEGDGNMLVFNFDEPFDYDGSKNLVVTLLKSSDKYAESWPVFFKIYNDDWNSEVYRSMQFEDNSVQEAQQGDGYGNPYLPVLHLAVESEGTGIGSIVIGGDGISFNDGTISLSGIDAVSLTVYDVAGRKVADCEPAEGQTEVKANLTQGIYVVKVTDRDGKTYTKKIRSVR